MLLLVLACAAAAGGTCLAVLEGLVGGGPLEVVR